MSRPLATPLLRVAPALPRLGLARHLFERNYLLFRRDWIILVSGFFEPLFYLLSIGVGIAQLVGDVPGPDGRPIPYAVFIAPAMLASSAMNGAVIETTFNVFFKLRYAKVYDAVLATPVSPRDIAVGDVAWALFRCLLYAAMFLLVMLGMGLIPSWWTVLALPGTVLVGFAFAATGMAATTYMRSWQDFDLIALVTLPMFLFSATFYPLSAYPAALQWVVEVTPLYHGVALLRGLVTGAITPGLLVHATYLVVMGLIGLTVAARRLERLLLR